jgi:hypothetical protein
MKKRSGHEGVNHRIALIGQRFDQNENKDRHARGLRAQAVFATEVEKVPLVHLQAETEMMKKIQVRIQIFPQGSVDLAVCGTEVAAASEDVEDFSEMRQIKGAGFRHRIFSRRIGRAIRVASGRK